jgi:hypothetical protein
MRWLLWSVWINSSYVSDYGLLIADPLMYQLRVRAISHKHRLNPKNLALK